MSLADFAKKTLAKKDAMSTFLKVADGQTVHIERVRSVTDAEKTDPSGKAKPVLKLTVDVNTEFGLVAKVFEVGSGKLISEMVEAGIDVGSSFDISRKGDKLETTYAISNVVNAPTNPLA
jgi:hypothetical protein